jgi:sensor histidine kinase YesM
MGMHIRRIYITACLVLLAWFIQTMAGQVIVASEKMLKVEMPGPIVVDAHYNYLNAKLIAEGKAKGEIYRHKNRILRNLDEYWMNATLFNPTTDTLRLVGEGRIKQAWLGEKPLTICDQPCEHFDGYIGEKLYFSTYFDLPPGHHDFTVKISNYQLDENFRPTISHITPLSVYFNNKRDIRIYIIASFIGIVFIIMITAFIISIRISDKAYAWYGIFLTMIMVHSFRNLEMDVPNFMLTILWVPWIYTKHFFLIIFYYSYASFVMYFVNAKEKYDTLYQILRVFRYFLIALLVPEIILLAGGIHDLSYSYYFACRLILSFCSLLFIIYISRYYRDRYVQFIIFGSILLTLAEAISNFLPSQIDSEIASLGIIGDIVVFSVGLAYRLQQYYKEKHLFEAELHSKDGEIAGLESERSALNISVLQSRMNPHFIFNSLNSINRYILLNDKDNASYYLSQFAKLIRNILDHSTDKEILLAEEIKTLEIYLELESLRFNNKLKYNIYTDVALDIENVFVPPLIIQPFVENAIWHGLMPKKNHCHLWIRFIKSHKQGIRIEIEDDGIGREASARLKSKSLNNHESKGIHLIQERLNWYGRIKNKTTSIIIEDIMYHNNIVGTKVILEIVDSENS